jgi:hypothetical protein
MASARSHAHRPHGAWPYASMVVVTRQLPLARQPLDHASPFTNRDQSSGGAIATPYKIFESGILPRIVLPSLVLVASVHPHDPSSCPAIALHLCLRCRSARLRHSEECKAGLRGWWFRLSRRAAVSSCLRFVRSSDVDADLCVASLALGDVRRRCEWWWHRILSLFAPSRESEMGWDEGSLLLLLFLMLKRRFSMTCWSFGLGSISWSWMMFLVGLEGCGANTQ